MKTIKLLLGFSLTAISFSYLSAQDWVEMMNDGKTNVHDVQKAFYSWYAAKEKNKSEEAKDLIPKEGDEEEDENYMLFKRWEWMMVPRTYPSGNRPDYISIANEYTKYLAQKNTSKANDSHRATTAASWTYAGNTTEPVPGGSGRVNMLRFYPGNNNIIFACTPAGGLWKTTNGGATWSTNTDQLLDIATSDIAIDPVNPNIMYLATGDGDGRTPNPSTIGVLKSIDGGTTWNPTGLYFNQSNTGIWSVDANQLLINPGNHNLILAATTSGLYYSSDAGAFWTEVITGDIRSIVTEPFHPNTIYASSQYGAFYRSADSGETWTYITSGLPAATGNVGRAIIAVSPADSEMVYVLVAESWQSNYGFYGIYRSTDRGFNFIGQATREGGTLNLLDHYYGTDSGGQGYYDLALAVSPTNADSLILGGVDIWLSGDGGLTWTLNSDWINSRAPYVHADIHSLTYLPGNGNTYYAASDGGVSYTANNGATWNDISNNLEISQQYRIGPSNHTAGLYLTGWQDNGTEVSGSPWSALVGGDGSTCFIDYNNDSNYFASTYTGNGQITLEFSPKKGAAGSWKNIGTPEQAGGVYVPFLQDPLNPNILFAGMTNIWKSVNQGTNWTKITASDTGIIAFALDSANDNIMYAAQGYSTELSYTFNGGLTWNNVTGAYPVSYNIGIPYLMAITLNPKNPAHVWVAFSGYVDSVKVFQSYDTGHTWKNISAGLPNLPVNCIAFQSGGPEGVYVGTDRGVFYHDTLLNTWVDFSNGLPNVLVNDLKISTTFHTLLAATYGRGTWQTSLYTPPVSKPVAMFSAFPTSICAGDTVQFFDASSNQPSAWYWTFTSGTPATSNLQNPLVAYFSAGTFPVKLVVNNLNGSDSLTLTNYISVNGLPPVPVITQSSDTLYCNPSGMASYQWFFEDSVIAGATFDIYTQFPTLKFGAYKVVVTNSNGCSDTNSFVVNLFTGISNYSMNDSISVYPNPATDNIIFESYYNNMNNACALIYNVFGQMVQKVKLNPDMTTISTNNLSRGIYLYRIYREDSVLKTGKIVLQ